MKHGYLILCDPESEALLQWIKQHDWSAQRGYHLGLPIPVQAQIHGVCPELTQGMAAMGSAGGMSAPRWGSRLADRSKSSEGQRWPNVSTAATRTPSAETSRSSSGGSRTG